MQQMYEASANSPQTTLAADIDDTITTIPVTDASVLPPAPNIAVIGFTTDVGETVVYTGVDGNVLTGCIRGFQGTARSWPRSTTIARVFTAYDHNTFIANINDLYTLLTADRSGIEEIANSTTQASNTEKVIFAHRPTTAKYICGWLDLSAIAAGDTIIVRMYIGGKLHSVDSYSDVLGTPMIYIDRRTVAAGDEYKITVQQSAGTTYRNIGYQFFAG